VAADGKDNKRLNEPVQIPAGLMVSVFVEFPVNSDYTQDVYAQITSGELESATLIGKVVVPYLDDPVMPRDKFQYEFNRMVYNRQTIDIDAVTITLDNDSGMVEADDVDYHVFQRYGGLIVASAVQALDASFLDNQAEQNARAQNEMLNAADTLIYGQNTANLTRQNMKTATTHVSNLAKEQFTRRPTIKKGAGPQLVIFRQQVQDPRLPMVMLNLR
jgi:hypothetical protein